VARFLKQSFCNPHAPAKLDAAIDRFMASVLPWYKGQCPAHGHTHKVCIWRTDGADNSPFLSEWADQMCLRVATLHVDCAAAPPHATTLLEMAMFVQELRRRPGILLLKNLEALADTNAPGNVNHPIWEVLATDAIRIRRTAKSYATVYAMLRLHQMQTLLANGLQVQDNLLTNAQDHAAALQEAWPVYEMQDPIPSVERSPNVPTQLFTPAFLDSVWLNHETDSPTRAQFNEQVLALPATEAIRWLIQIFRKPRRSIELPLGNVLVLGAGKLRNPGNFAEDGFAEGVLPPDWLPQRLLRERLDAMFGKKRRQLLGSAHLQLNLSTHADTPVQLPPLSQATDGMADAPAYLPTNACAVAAVHEAGHAICIYSKLGLSCDMALFPAANGLCEGKTRMRPPQQPQLGSWQQVYHTAVCLLAGGVAEALVFGHMHRTDGGKDDLRAARKLLKRALQDMAPPMPNRTDTAAHKPAALPHTADALQHLLHLARQEAYDTLVDRLGDVKWLARMLYEAGTLTHLAFAKWAEMRGLPKGAPVYDYANVLYEAADYQPSEY
jgi:hypothetical protein